MADKKTPAKTPEQHIADLEARIAQLETCKCPCRKIAARMGDLCKDGKCPSQDELREWVKANPFLALGVTALATAIVVAIIF